MTKYLLMKDGVETQTGFWTLRDAYIARTSAEEYVVAEERGIKRALTTEEQRHEHFLRIGKS